MLTLMYLSGRAGARLPNRSAPWRWVPALSTLAPTSVGSTTVLLPVGTTTFTSSMDDNADGQMNGTFADTVTVRVTK